jgi:two-component system, LytTR family, response regulator
VSRRFSALVVDDEPLARETLRLLLARDPEIDVAEAGDGRAALEAIAAHRPDLLFLDIQMPGLDGFDVLSQAEEGAVRAVVFVTAFERYALQAFDAHAVDYLLKPFDDARFERALLRAKERARAADPLAGRQHVRGLLEALSSIRGQALRRFLVRTGDRQLVVAADDVDWIGAADDYCELHVGPRAHLVRQTMNELEERLDPTRFARVHRSTIVSLDRVREMHPHVRGDWDVVLRDGTVVRLSRTYRAAFEEKLLAMRA